MGSTLGQRVAEGVRTLSPGYFSLVMATGIISIGLELEGRELASTVLFAVTAVSYLVLITLTLWRLVAFRQDFTEDFSSAARGFEFFTFVAGTDVLATRIAIEGWHVAALVLLVVAGAAWLVLGYVVPWLAVLGRSARPVLRYANGTWFIWVVASQSVAVVAATLEPRFELSRDAMAALAVLAWSIGIFLYAAAGAFVALRLLMYELEPEDMGPPYWVAMGAAAITVVAGARIVEMAASPMADAIRQLVAGVSIVFWAFATWLIPVLVAVGFWRHVRHRIPLRYEPALWGMIFPLGMYGVAGIYLGQADDLPLVHWIGDVELWVAVVAWLVVLVGMGVRLWGVLSGRAQGVQRARAMSTR